MPTPTEAIKAFLNAFTHSDLAALYSPDMEVQVNVAQDGGERIKGEYKGRTWQGYTDGVQEWKAIRIPWNAATEPKYSETNRKMRFDLSEHAEAIGMTGWNWRQGVSQWVAYDFDSIIEHDNNSLSAVDLQQIQKIAFNIPWVTVRQSTGGSGLHLYVFLNDIPTKTHTEHAALGRAILSKMSAEAGFDFINKVDACGQNMWIWHRKMKGAGLKLLKQGSMLIDIPINWKDHLTVIKGVRRKNLPQFIGDTNQSLFEEITSQRACTKLDDEHKKLLDYLKEIDVRWWWDTDHQMLVCHTFDLKRAHKELNLRGIFKTIATGKEQGNDHNCYLFPKVNGAWVVRRYVLGTQETLNWGIDAQGWTRCFFNQAPDLKITARTHDGVEDDKGTFHFNEAETAATAVSFLGTNLKLPVWACSRPTQIKPHKDGRLIVSVKKESNDNIQQMQGWREEKGFWKKIFDSKIKQSNDSEISNYDNIIRHLSNQEGNDYGWVIKSGDSWHTEPLVHIRAALKSLNLSNREIDLAIGKCIIESWSIVNEPFDDEYLGNRKWNRDAVQFCFVPSQKEPFNCPTWNKILSHVGSGLDAAVLKNGWCQANSIVTGSDYLRVWVASLFQQPKEPLPYLFFYSKEECTGKSTFHEALCILITKSGYARADAALLSQQAFNAELENAVLCIIQESDLRKGAQVRNRLKDWVTSPEIAIHTKGKTPYLARNTTHYVHTANNYEECPIFSGDTRITMSYVKPIDPLEMIPRKQLYKQLEQEAPDFMAVILGLEIPPCIDRLNIPVVDTIDKIQTGKMNRTVLETFLDECCFYVPGHKILYSEVWNHFQEFLPPETIHLWSKIKLGRELPRQYIKGRSMKDGGQFYVGNISWTSENSGAEPLKLDGEILV